MKTEQLDARTEQNAAAAITRAADLVRSGRLVAFPTETVYGLGANAIDAAAVARLFAAKRRPTFDPLIVHIADRRDLALVFSAAALNDPRVACLTDVFWPGALTIVAPAAATIPGIVRAGLPSVGVRIPDHELARALIRAAGTPIAAPSANLFGQLSPTSAAHVLDQLEGRIDAVILGEPPRIGVESSVVSLLPGEPARLLRAGGVPRELIAATLAPFGALGDPLAHGPLAAPGMTASHYAPRTQLRIVDLGTFDVTGLTHVALLAPDDETLARLRAVSTDLEVVAAASLSATLDPVRAAAHLFELLHRLDASLHGVDASKCAIVTTPYPEQGLGLAIADRLRRASEK